MTHNDDAALRCSVCHGRRWVRIRGVKFECGTCRPKTAEALRKGA